MLHSYVSWNDTWARLNALPMKFSMFSPLSPVLFSANIFVFLVETTRLKNRVTFVLSEVFCVSTALQHPLLKNPYCTSSYLQIHFHQSNPLSDPHWSNYPMSNVGFDGILFLCPLISFHHQLHRLLDSLHLNIAPYIPPRRIHMQLMYVPIYT